MIIVHAKRYEVMDSITRKEIEYIDEVEITAKYIQRSDFTRYVYQPIGITVEQ